MPATRSRTGIQRDPLKPMDNFQFVSQLAQFSQLQQSQVLNTTADSLLSAQNASTLPDGLTAF